MARDNFTHEAVCSTPEYECSQCNKRQKVRSTDAHMQGWFDVNSYEWTMLCSLQCLTDAQLKKKKRSHKFNAKKSEDDGISFSSKAERSYYQKLKFLQSQKEVVFFLRQVPLHLPGNTKYVVDFLVFNADGTVSFIDVKGMETPMFKMKKKQVEDLYPITIETVS